MGCLLFAGWNQSLPDTTMGREKGGLKAAGQPTDGSTGTYRVSMIKGPYLGCQFQADGTGVVR